MKSKDNFASRFINSLRGNTDTIGKKDIDIPDIEEILENLICISDEDWGMYAFKREPLKGKFNIEEKKELIFKANECGREQAKEIRRKYGSINIYEIAEKLRLEIDYPDKPNGGGHSIFAQYVEPNKITIFKDSVNKAVSLINERALEYLFEQAKVEEILLAHEIFHFIEENNKDIFTRTEKIRLWKVGPLKNDSSIVCLGEIA
ncbi:MAG: hypothetical protein MJ191_07350, partial [Clostridium sp.]|nr:hypothetical protein [Clostridium sp.]